MSNFEDLNEQFGVDCKISDPDSLRQLVPVPTEIQSKIQGGVNRTKSVAPGQILLSSINLTEWIGY